ncbi:MAG: class D sortase [Paraclostridium sp.]
MKNKISKLLLIIGFILIIGSVYIKIYSKNQENKGIKNFENKSINMEKEIYDMGNVEIGDEIAIIKIPSIKLNTVVVHGMEKEYLDYYVCHFENSSMPGELGNFSLAGHSSYIYNEVFNNLHKVKVNDEIHIKTLENEFIYTITDISEVTPDRVDVLKEDMNKKEITIVTCTSSGKNRLIVKGEIK